MIDFTDDDQRQLDLLIDGELSEDERRALLMRLENEPEGWRRCALAFLEAQAWKSSLRTRSPVTPSRPANVQASPNQVPNVEPQSARHHRAIWLARLGNGASYALAAALLVALGVGLGLPLHSESRHSDNASVRLAGAGSRNQHPTPVGQRMTLVDQSGRAVELPLFEQGDAAAILFDRPSALSGDTIRRLERLGHGVRQQRQFLHLYTDDGRPVVVPIDEVEVSPTDAGLYQ